MPGFSAPRLQKDEGSSVGAGQSQKVCSDLCTLCSRFWFLSSRDAGLLEPLERHQGSPTSSSVWREDPGLLSRPCTAGTLRSESETQRKPEFPFVSQQSHRNSRKTTWFPLHHNRVLSPNGRGGWTPLRPLRGLQEPRVATREEIGRAHV